MKTSHLFILTLVTAAILAGCKTSGTSSESETENGKLLITAYGVEGFVIGQKIPTNTKTHTIRKTFRTIEGTQEPYYNVYENGHIVLSFMPAYNYAKKRFSDTIGDVTIWSDKYVTSDGISVGMTVGEVREILPDAAIAFSYVSDRFWISAEFQLNLDPDGFIGQQEYLYRRDLVTVRPADFREDAPILSIRVYGTVEFDDIPYDDFVLSGYAVTEEILGDLNGDGVNDAVLITRDERRDASRHSGISGLFVLLRKGKTYELAVAKPRIVECPANAACTLSTEIKDGKLYILCDFGEYGSRKYTFRHHDNRFELIGFDADYRFSGKLEEEVSINFLTKRKQIKLYEQANNRPRMKEERWVDILVETLPNLADMEDFYAYGVGRYYTEK